MKRLIFLLLALLALASGPSNAGDPVLGSGDIIKISVFGNPELGMELRVAETGTINFPLIGEVKVAGLDTAEAEKKVARMLHDGGYVNNPQVNIMLRVLQSSQVSLLGQVNKPGRYPLDGVQTLTDLLALAGGPTADSADVITLLRNEGGSSKRHLINLAEIMRTGDARQNPVLTNGDVIYLERAPRCYVFGEVQRPGAYRIERDMTVLQAISAGGGLSPRGTVRGITVRRKLPDGSTSTIGARLDDRVQADDVVHVKESLF